MKNSLIQKALIVPGLPHVLLAPEKNAGWKKLNDAYAEARKEIEACNPDLILYFSTQWLSVLGYTFQADPSPEWLHVDQNWHDLGSMPYKFKVDAEFARAYAEEVKKDGHNTQLANYRGFPIDTGTIVAQKLLNPNNKIPAAMVSCNMYAEKQETIAVGRRCRCLPSRKQAKGDRSFGEWIVESFFVKEIDPREDKISSAKDDEWNRKICELLSDGRLEDVAQVARELAKKPMATWASKAFGGYQAYAAKQMILLARYMVMRRFGEVALPLRCSHQHPKSKHM